MSTGLAAVNAAAESVSKSDHEAAVTKARADGLAEGQTAGRKEGADAERARIFGIEAIAVKGHEKLVAECKADPSITPEMAALRILGAERQQREGQMQQIQGVETITGVVAAAPTSQPTLTPPKASTPEGWKAEYAASADLQRDFASADAYANYAAGVAAGRIRVLKATPGA